MRRIDLRDGAHLELSDGWLDQDEAARMFVALQSELDFQVRTIRLFGREVPQPRLVTWVGDPDAAYTYSGTRHEPLPWTPTLTVLRTRLVRELSLPFNSVLCNLYRDGQDSMGMHSDNERELGDEPVVASVSLGATRTFSLRHRHERALGKLDLALKDGSLLVMRGSTQRVYRHGVPKQRTPVGPRMNLTFRIVRSA